MDFRPDRFAVRLFLALVAITAFPYLLAALTSPPGASFVWALGFLPDTLAKFSFARQAAEGALLFCNPYTAEPHPALYFNPYFLAVGWLSGATRLPPGLCLQLARILWVAVFVSSLCAAARLWFIHHKERNAACLLICFSGGLGFLSLVFPLFHLSADIQGAEMTTFFSLYQQGHFAASLALIVLLAALLGRAFQSGGFRTALAPAAAHLALAAVHPYDLPVTFAAATMAAVLFPVVARRPVPWRPLLVFLSLPLPLIIYNGYLITSVPVFREFSRQGLIADPWSAGAYLLGYAPLLPFAALGAAEVIRRRDPAWFIPLAWVLAVPLLLALPIPARRKLFEGSHLMLCLLAARGVFSIITVSRWRFWAPAGLILASLSSAYVVSRDMYSLSISRRPERVLIGIAGGRLHYPFDSPLDRAFQGSPWLAGLFLHRADTYDLPESLGKAFAWMDANLPADAVVLTAPPTGLLLPVHCARKVVAGHLFETIDYGRKIRTIASLMDGRLDPARRRTLAAGLNADYLLLDRALMEMGDWRPSGETWLKPLAAFGEIVIYAAKP